jgi:hypothetical protein
MLFLKAREKWLAVNRHPAATSAIVSFLANRGRIISFSPFLPRGQPALGRNRRS